MAAPESAVVLDATCALGGQIMTKIIKTKTKMQYLVTLQDKTTGKLQTQRILAKTSAIAGSRALSEAKAKAAGEYVVTAIDVAY